MKWWKFKTTFKKFNHSTNCVYRIFVFTSDLFFSYNRGPNMALIVPCPLNYVYLLYCGS